VNVGRGKRFFRTPAGIRCMDEGMPRRHFTVVEINRMIPELEVIFTEVIQLHAGMRRAEVRLSQLGCSATREVLSGEDDGGSPELRMAKGMLRGFYEALVDGLGRVADLGGEVKDLEVGVVDFPGRRGSEEICLCWKLGEKRLGHWHTGASGWAGRRPIDHLVPLEPSPLD